MYLSTPQMRLLRACLLPIVIGVSVAEAKTTEFRYNAIGSLGSPWVGLVPYAPGDSAESFPHSMEKFYISMASLMAGWSNFTFAAFEHQLDDIASRNNQAICRVYLDYPGKTRKKTDGVPAFLVPGLKFYSYDSGVSPDWSNTTLRRAMTTLIRALGKKYDGDNRIAFWQVGFLGQWGEFQLSTVQ